MAEGPKLERQVRDIYEVSYLRMMNDRNGRKALPYEKFRTRLYRLCHEDHGGILRRKRNSWYSFKENVIRGYVRVIAERHGVRLGEDHY